MRAKEKKFEIHIRIRRLSTTETSNVIAINRWEIFAFIRREGENLFEYMLLSFDSYCEKLGIETREKNNHVVSMETSPRV